MFDNNQKTQATKHNQFRLQTLLFWTALFTVFCASFVWIRVPGMLAPVLGFWLVPVIYVYRRLGEAPSFLVCLLLGGSGVLLSSLVEDRFGHRVPANGLAMTGFFLAGAACAIGVAGSRSEVPPLPPGSGRRAW